MGDENKVELDSEFLLYGSVLGTSVKDQQGAISEGLTQRLGVLRHSQDVLVSCLGSIHSRIDREVDDKDVIQKVHRASIHSSIIQGLTLVERALASACYPQAAALIRQEIEAVEVCEGLRSKRQKEGRTPRLKVLRHLGRHYGVLSSLAHLSRSDYLIGVTQVLQTGIDPHLNEALERDLFCVHLVSLVGICLDAAELRPISETQMLTDQEEAWLNSVCGVLVAEGYLPTIGSEE